MARRGSARRASADPLPEQLVSWLDHEVKARLLHIDRKLDDLLLAAAKSPRGHRGSSPADAVRGTPTRANRNAVLSPIGRSAPDPSLPAGRGGTVWRQLGPAEQAVPDDSPPNSARSEGTEKAPRRGLELRLPPLFLGARADRPPEGLPGDVMSVNAMSASSSARAKGMRAALPALPALAGMQADGNTGTPRTSSSSSDNGAAVQVQATAPAGQPPSQLEATSDEGQQPAETSAPGLRSGGGPVVPARPVPPALREVGEGPVRTTSTGSTPEALKKQVSWRRPGSGGLESPQPTSPKDTGRRRSAQVHAALGDIEAEVDVSDSGSSHAGTPRSADSARPEVRESPTQSVPRKRPGTPILSAIRAGRSQGQSKKEMDTVPPVPPEEPGTLESKSAKGRLRLNGLSDQGPPPKEEDEERTSRRDSAASSVVESLRGGVSGGFQQQQSAFSINSNGDSALEAAFSGLSYPNGFLGGRRDTMSVSSSSGNMRQSYFSGGPRSSSHRRSMASVQMMKVWEMLPAPARSEWAHTVWKILDDGESSLVAKLYEQVMQCFIVISMITCMLQSLEQQPLQGLPGVIVETCIDCIFVAEVVLRFLVCPNRTMFWLNVFNYIDIASTIPLLLRCVMGFQPAQVEECVGSMIHPASCVHSILIAIVPFLRLAKMLRRFLTLHLLLKAFRSALEALPVLIFIYCLILLGFSGLLFVVETRGNLHTYYYSMWLTIVSMTTLGYGDVTPKTDQGRAVIGFCVICTMFYTAIPLGIIGNAFNDVWKNRDRLLLMQRARNGMKQAGYTAKDVGKLFRIFDKDRDGLLNVKEFSWMVEGMRLGLKRDRVLELYELFDDDDSGGIDEREFVKGLFPERYHELYGDNAEDESPTGAHKRSNDTTQTMVSENGDKPGLIRPQSTGTAARVTRSTLQMPGR